MKIDNSNLISVFLSKLGFDHEEIKLYLILTKKGPLTLLNASREGGIERTKLYRMIDDLIKRKLIEEVPAHKRQTIKAVDLHQIELLVKEKELQSQFLLNTLPTFSNALEAINKPGPENNVIYYRGAEGIKQMSWNILRCKGIYRTYSYRFWDDILGASYVLKLNAEMLERNFQVRDLYSDQYIAFKKEWMAQGKGKPKGDWHFWESRYLPEKVLTVNQNIDVYNDVVAYYYWQGKETFGVEIYNKRVANFHKQIHDVMWHMAKKRPDIDWTKEWKK